MASQAARALLKVTFGPEGQVALELELVCGCRLEVMTAADRVVTTVNGLTLAVGKFPCPNGHPVQRPEPRT